MYLLVILGSMSITSFVTYIMLTRSLGGSAYFGAPTSSPLTYQPSYMPTLKPSSPSLLPTLLPTKVPLISCLSSDSLRLQDQILCDISNGLLPNKRLPLNGWSCEGLAPYSPICYQLSSGWTGVNCSSCAVIGIDVSYGASFTGTISSSIGLLGTLQSLRIADVNSYSNKGSLGTLPHSIGLLSSLTVLHIFSNGKMGGTIPTSLAALSRLQRLELSYNALGGPIPTGLASLSQLRYVDLNSNALTGKLPSSTWYYSLLHLDLSHNKISGPLINGLSMPINNQPLSLAYLSLSSNHLTGTIPTVLRNKLTALYLDSNSLFGSIPSTLCQNNFSISSLNMARNSFICYPACLSSTSNGVSNNLPRNTCS